MRPPVDTGPGYQPFFKEQAEPRGPPSGPGAGFLIALDALVRKDVRPPGFQAKVCLCLRQANRDLFWYARITDRAECAFTQGVPSDAQTVLILSAEDAESLLKTGKLSGSTTKIGGDRGALLRLLERYGKPHDLLSLRASITRTKRRRE